MILSGRARHVICTPNLNEGKYLAAIIRGSGVNLVEIHTDLSLGGELLYIHEDMWEQLEIPHKTTKRIRVWSPREIIWEPLPELIDRPFIRTPDWIAWKDIQVSGIFGFSLLRGVIMD